MYYVIFSFDILTHPGQSCSVWLCQNNFLPAASTSHSLLENWKIHKKSNNVIVINVPVFTGIQ